VNTLTAILAYHVAPGVRDAADVVGSSRIRTLQGSFLRQSGGVLTDALGRTSTIIVTNVPASNGIIHAIDTVAQELTPHYGADCPAAVVVRASWPDERVLRGTLATIAALVKAEAIERTALILVGSLVEHPRNRDVPRPLRAPSLHRRLETSGLCGKLCTHGLWRRRHFRLPRP